MDVSHTSLRQKWLYSTEKKNTASKLNWGGENEKERKIREKYRNEIANGDVEDVDKEEEEETQVLTIALLKFVYIESENSAGENFD